MNRNTVVITSAAFDPAAAGSIACTPCAGSVRAASSCAVSPGAAWVAAAPMARGVAAAARSADPWLLPACAAIKVPPGSGARAQQTEMRTTRRTPSRRGEEGNEAGQDGAKQRQKHDCLIHALVSLS